jgi:uncharacterized protein
LEIVTSVSKIPAAEWDALTGGHPLLRHAFFLALEESGCASPKTGWQPAFLVEREIGKVEGFMPLYFKTHSFGEFVFDHAWADAYQQNSLAYYPKLVSSIPFTPVAGGRIFGAPEVQKKLAHAARELAVESGASSLHVLFPTLEAARALEGQGFLLRKTLQFHWRREGKKNFSEFLEGMRHEKRKKIKQERRKIAEAGISFRLVVGSQATEADWDFFFLCYTRTHILYNSPQAFNRDFFARLARTMPENLLLVIGEREGTPIAAAFNVFHEGALFGRSWGCTEYVPGLHFETCYYQAIEFCLERGIDLFEGGAQGEHKLARGLLPVTTWSAHWLAHPEFFRAVEDFLQREGRGMSEYVNELEESSPFKRG